MARGFELPVPTALPSSDPPPSGDPADTGQGPIPGEEPRRVTASWWSRIRSMWIMICARVAAAAWRSALWSSRVACPFPERRPIVPPVLWNWTRERSVACRLECPLGVNVQAYMALTAAGRFEEALDIIKEDNPLPGICGRVCHHPCEASCRRRELDQAVAICDVKRFLSDYQVGHGNTSVGEASRVSPVKPRRQRTGGDCRLRTGRAHCRTLPCQGWLPGHHFRGLARSRVGCFAGAFPLTGCLAIFWTERFRISSPLGVELKCNTRIGQEICLEELEREFDAIFLAVGAQRSTLLGISGEDADGCFGAVELLRAHHLGQKVEVGKKVAVIGGGNSAIDAARTALRLGADVTIFYRRERQDMPAQETEIAAAEAEGVRIEYRVGPTRVLTQDGKVSGLELIRMELGEEDDSGRRSAEADCRDPSSRWTRTPSSPRSAKVRTSTS